VENCPTSGGPRRSIHPLTVASFRTWRSWAAHTRTVPDAEQFMVICGAELVKGSAPLCRRY